MATMIPDTLGPHDVYKAERKVFEALRNDPATDDWTVLYNCQFPGIGRRKGVQYDFLIFIPGFGVLNLEIKGGASVKRDGKGRWYLSGKEIERSPFDQAREAKFLLKDIEGGPYRGFNSVPLHSIVLFPECRFNLEGPDWAPYEVLDCSVMVENRLGAAIVDAIEAERRDWLTKEKSWLLAVDCSVARLDAYVQWVRGSFQVQASPRDQRAYGAQVMYQLTQEQMKAVACMRANQRVVITGLAGTGKTFLALQAAREAVLEGKRTLLACHNRALANWLRVKGPQSDLLTIKTLHSLMAKVANVHVPKGDKRDLDDLLPRLASAELLKRRFESYDVLILDEAQDLLKAEKLEFLDLLLKGGLRDGHWRIFADPRQELDFSAVGLRDLRAFCDNFFRFELLTNCRNTRHVGEFAQRLGGFQFGYDEFRRLEAGSEPEVHFYDSRVDQAARLIKTLRDAALEEFNAGEIVVLSARKRADSVASHSRIDPMLVPFGKKPSAPGQYSYSTIHAFRGLEAPCVILTDVDKLDTQTRQLIYLGATRALFKLIVLADRSLASGFQRALSVRDVG